MGNLNSKAKSASVLALAVACLIAKLISSTSITSELILLAGALTGLALFVAEMKDKKWSQFSWIWTAFFLPYILAQTLLLDYLVQYTEIRWMLAVFTIYLSMLPVIVGLMIVHLQYTCRYLFTEDM